MTFAQSLGREAGLLGQTLDACPYKGNTSGSCKLRERWLHGFELGNKARLKAERAAENMLEQTKPVRAKSEYARRRIEQIRAGEV